MCGRQQDNKTGFYTIYYTHKKIINNFCKSLGEIKSPDNCFDSVCARGYIVIVVLWSIVSECEIDKSQIIFYLYDLRCVRVRLLAASGSHIRSAKKNICCKLFNAFANKCAFSMALSENTRTENKASQQIKFQSSLCLRVANLFICLTKKMQFAH